MNVLAKSDPMVRVESGWSEPPTHDARLFEVYRYWNARRGDRWRPTRDDIRPSELKKQLPYIFLVDVLNRPRRFRMRLAGHSFFQTAGYSINGRFIEEIFPPEMCEATRAHWNACAETSMPSLGRGRVMIPGKEFLIWEGIILPLGPETGPADMLLGAVVSSGASARGDHASMVPVR